jgi:hypothetical protein
MSFSSDTLNYLFHKYNRPDGASIHESIQKSDESIRISILENQILKLTHIIDLQEKRLETHDVILQSLDLSKIKFNIIESDVTSSLSKRGVNFDYNGVLSKILQTNNQHQTNTKGDINSNIDTSQGQPLASDSGPFRASGTAIASQGQPLVMGKEEITLESRQQFLSDMQDINNNIDDAEGCLSLEDDEAGALESSNEESEEDEEEAEEDEEEAEPKAVDDLEAAEEDEEEGAEEESVEDLEAAEEDE